jgi:hypothetical protein
MKLAIVGSRTFNDFEYLEESIFNNLKVDYITEIVSGGAKGADTLAEIFAKKYELPITIFNADWNTFGKRAGFIRNETIIKNCDFLIAFWNGISKGTKHSINLARKELGEEKVLIIKIPIKE